MALRNDENISALGRRLYLLMDEKTVRTPKELATIFYSRELVHVNSRDNDNDPSKNRNNAIQSIEKKIARHIKTGIIADQTGDFLIAYSSFFECSADYILGLTDIRSPDVEVKRICELLGLTENVVNSLIKCQRDENYSTAACWSVLMDSPLFHSLPEDIVTMGNEWYQMLRYEGELRSLKKSSETANGPDLMDLQLDMEGTQLKINSSRAAFYGLLAKASRNYEEVIETFLLGKYESLEKFFQNNSGK